MSENNKTQNILRWVARIWSLGPIFFVLAHLFEDDVAPATEVTTIEYVTLAFLGIYVLGLIIAWRWELIGGLISVGSFLIFLVLFVLFVERVFPAILIFIFGAFPPAFIFTYLGCKTRK